MSKRIYIFILAGLIFLMGCEPACPTYVGYGRFSLSVNCGYVEIDGETYSLTQRDDELIIAGHTIGRGIYRKDRPWLYIHQINGSSADITFEEGLKPEYPLYTGSTASISDVYATDPWPITLSTNAAFPDNYWLISHRWSDTGVFFDLQHMGENLNSWELVKEIFVPGDGSEIDIDEINTRVKIISFNPTDKMAEVLFTHIP